MLADSVTKFRIETQRTKEGYLSPKKGFHVTNSEFLSQHNKDIKRPLNNNHHDLSFKGLSFMPKLYKPLDKVYKQSEFVEFTDKYLGKMGRELLENITKTHKDRTSKLIEVRKINPNGGNEDSNLEIVIKKKTIPHLALDGVVYPFKILPGDMLNGVVELLGKVPGLKNWSAQTLEKPLFKNIRQRSKIDAKVNSLVGLITYRDEKIASAKSSYAKSIGKKVEELSKTEIDNIISKVDENMGSSVFQSEMKMFDPKTGNYDTKHERALNRLVSGLPPAVFLATDAYNLSRMMDDDDKAAEKERKIRFKQEASRILTSGYLTLITMGAFQKFINKSKMGIVLTTGITVLVTEMFSRLSNGKHITRLTPEQARKINERENAPEADIKPQQNIPSTGNPDKSKEKAQQKPLLSFDTLMKASAVVLALGYGIKGFKNIPAIKNAAMKYFENMDSEKLNKLGLNKEKINLDNAVKTFEDKVIYRPFTQLYKRLTTEKYTVDAKKFNDVVEILDKNGFSELAAKYKQVGESAIKTENGQQILDLGAKDKKVKPLVNFVIAPFKFMWNTVTLPYWMIDEKIGNLFRKAKPKSAPKDIDALAKSFEKISRKAQALANKNITQKEFEDYVQINLLKAFNLDTLSSVSNAELSNLAKTAASIATIWFLMTDNYNMVMLKSNGNDKDGANTKFKERFVQEGSRLFYQTLLIDLFNSTFMKSYNGSLLGMSWVTLADTTLGEILTRSSVGIATKPHTRDELIALEEKQNNSTGFKKKYYNFMQRLTGKRSIKSYEVAPKNVPTAEPQQNQTQNIVMTKNIMFQNNGTLDRLIKEG